MEQPDKNRMISNSEGQKVFFPGLNGLRFFAAFAVMVTHIELVKYFKGYPSLWSDKAIQEYSFTSVIKKLVFEAGALGVYFFFVLSGFLITFLLLKERETTGSISVRKFYWRRILRIWPLYYLLVIAGFIFIPYCMHGQIMFDNKQLNDAYGLNLLLYLIIFPNIAHAMFQPVPLISQTWSIGVEEQFYLIWPWLAKKSKNIFAALSLVFAVMMLIKLLVVILINAGYQSSSLLVFKKFIAMSKIECMAIGGIGAWMLFKKKESILSFIYKPLVLPCSLIAVPIVAIIIPAPLQDAVHLIHSVFFICIILHIAANSNTKIKLEHPVLHWLGNISYSIYMYHFMMIPLVIFLLEKVGIFPSNALMPQLLLYTSTFATTVGISWLSYRYFEGYFLKWKSKYTVVHSGK